MRVSDRLTSMHASVPIRPSIPDRADTDNRIRKANGRGLLWSATCAPPQESQHLPGRMNPFDTIAGWTAFIRGMASGRKEPQWGTTNFTSE